MISPRLRWTRIEDCVFLLDIASGEYFGLDGDAALEWLSFPSMQDIAPAGPGDSALIHHATRRGWLLDPSWPPAPPFPTPRRGWAPDWRRHPLLSLVGTHWSMRHRGFGETYARIVELDRRSGLNAAPRTQTLLADFARSEAFVVSRLGFRDCLPRSLALFAFLRASGVPARHRIGVKRFPFSAHAWVESEGRPLGDDESSPQRFAVIAQIGA
jgi:hypothetical protein